jgi:hypothetical protein
MDHPGIGGIPPQPSRRLLVPALLEVRARLFPLGRAIVLSQSEGRSLAISRGDMEGTRSPSHDEHRRAVSVLWCPAMAGCAFCQEAGSRDAEGAEIREGERACYGLGLALSKRGPGHPPGQDGGVL